MLGRKGETEKCKYHSPFDGNNSYSSHNGGNGKGGEDKAKSKTFDAVAEKPEEQPAKQLAADKWLALPAQDMRRWPVMMLLIVLRDNESIVKKLIHDGTVFAHNLSVTTSHSLLAANGHTPEFCNP